VLVDSLASIRIIGLLVGALFVGCYQPSILNGGFTCLPDDSPACPEDFFCVDGRCVHRLPLGDLSPVVDAASPPPPDLRQTCGAPGDYCQHDSQCCSHWCIYHSNSCQ
jgi:hypothetical protein